jgi:ankyrin repeat protein
MAVTVDLKNNNNVMRTGIAGFSRTTLLATAAALMFTFIFCLAGYADDGYTPLMRAVADSDEYEVNTEVVRALIKAGADVNAKDNDGFTPLIWGAAKNGKGAEIVAVLIQAGADIHAKDNNGSTPLMWAAGCKNTEAVNTLIQAGADVNVKNGDGETALMWAAAYVGADVSANDKYDKSVLDYAKESLQKIIVDNE